MGNADGIGFVANKNRDDGGAVACPIDQRDTVFSQLIAQVKGVFLQSVDALGLAQNCPDGGLCRRH